MSLTSRSMNKNIVPVLGAVATAFVVNFLFAFAAAAAGEKNDVGLIVGLAAGVVVFIVLYNLSGNRKVAEADPAARQRALSFAPEPGRAALYLVRTGFIGKAAGMNFTVDGREVAQLKSPNFTCIALTPGAHTLVASFGGGLAGQTKPAEVAFTAAAGEIIVMHVTMGIGALKNPLKIERADVNAMRAQITGMKMTKPDLDSI